MSKSKEHDFTSDAVSAGLIAGGILLGAFTENKILTNVIAPGLILYGIFRLTQNHLFN